MLNQVRGQISHSLQTSNHREEQQRLADTHERIKNYIDNDLPPDTSLGPMDFAVMPQLVKWANTNYQGLTLHFAATPYALAETLGQMAQRGDTSARFVANLAPNEMHMCAFDYKVTNGKHSLIGLEPGNSNNMGPAMMVFRIEAALEEHLPETKFVMLEVNQQSSVFDCGLFSLDYAVKMHKSAGFFEQLHDQNADDRLIGKNEFNTVPHGEVDKILPPIFMKHMQSSKRLAETLGVRPELRAETVNNNETLHQRIKRHTIRRQTSTGEIATQNESIMYQREKYVRKALDL